jgi:CDP-diacylglycerol--serine O-phosphatidyltransferase
MNKWVLYSIIALTSFLMVSTWPMLSLKFQNMSIKQNWQKIILLILGIVGGFVFQWLTIPLIFLLYIVLSLLTENKRA